MRAGTNAAAMSTPTPLALLGFTDFEQRSFQAFFDLGREQGPGYEITADLWRAECAVADAGDDEAVARLSHAGLLERTVLLGSTPHQGAALQLPRPINLLLVMRALDTLVGARPSAGARLAPPPAAAAPKAPPNPPAPSVTRPVRSENQVQRVLDELAFRTATLPSNMDVRALARAGAAEAERAGRRSAALRRRNPEREPERDPLHARSEVLPMEHILVIDNDAATLRLVAIQLQRFGFQIHLAGHPDDAMRLLTSRFHDYIFVDPALPGLDALLVCRLARQFPAPSDRAATVVLLADSSAAAAPLERALPAADACLKKPLEQQALLRLMGEREVVRYAYADTARTTTII